MVVVAELNFYVEKLLHTAVEVEAEVGLRVIELEEEEGWINVVEEEEEQELKTR